MCSVPLPGFSDLSVNSCLSPFTFPLITEYLTLGGCNNRNLFFSTVLMVRSPAQGSCPFIFCWVFSSLQMAVSLCILTYLSLLCSWRQRSLCSTSFKATNPIGLGPHPCNLFNWNCLLKALSQNTVKWGVTSFNIWIWGGHMADFSLGFTEGCLFCYW